VASANPKKSIMAQYRLYQVDAFTTERFAGNPAGVVPNADGLSDAQMQAIARELNNSETAFVCKPQHADHEVWVRFFTPTTEVPSCGHATIAAHYVRAVENAMPTCTVVQKIGAGILPVKVVRRDADYQVVMTQAKPEFQEPLSGRELEWILRALGLDAGDVRSDCPVQIVSTGHSKVMIGIRDLDKLHALQPDLPKLAEISRRISCNGYYVFVLTPPDEYFVHGRMFAPAIGIAEDPVTGNANGPVGAYLVRHRLAPVDGSTLIFRARQGEAMGRPGTVEVSIDVEDGLPKIVRVAGQAVIVYRSALEL
jgi:PhzF family phenazine biosynthesis protein